VSGRSGHEARANRPGTVRPTVEGQGTGIKPRCRRHAGCRAINEDVGGCWPRVTSMFRAERSAARDTSMFRGQRSPKESCPRREAKANARPEGSELAECQRTSRSRLREPEPTPGWNRPECPKIVAGSPFPWTALLGGRDSCHCRHLRLCPDVASCPPESARTCLAQPVGQRHRRGPHAGG